MIVVTGAAGFIGSCLVSRLNAAGCTSLILVDDFSDEIKNLNLKNKKYRSRIHRDDFDSWLEQYGKDVKVVFHIGARTDTTEFDIEIFNKLNLNYSKAVWNTCVKHSIPLVYASSAATYGLGEFGYEDEHSLVSKLVPLNPYGNSKNDFDKWVLLQNEAPPFWYGLKFFNVYGPNEFHKGRMASVIFHAVKQIYENAEMKLFRSHKPEFKDGEQLRDFIYVKDVIEVCLFLYKTLPKSGLYNLGTGQCRSFLDLAKSTFKALAKPSAISFVDTPIDIRDKYQYFTEANMTKLKSVGYTNEFYSLENGITDYVKNYLIHNKYY